MSKILCIGITLLLLYITGVTVFAQAPGEWRYYENDDFSLAYPNSWKLREADRGITLSYEGYAPAGRTTLRSACRELRAAQAHRALWHSR